MRSNNIKASIGIKQGHLLSLFSWTLVGDTLARLVDKAIVGSLMGVLMLERIVSRFLTFNLLITAPPFLSNIRGL